jgi:hypothetical protein
MLRMSNRGEIDQMVGMHGNITVKSLVELIYANTKERE